MTHFAEAPPEVVDLITELIMLYHEPLESARIGLLMRDEAPVSNGFATLGQARKVSPEHRALMPYDFIIWFAQDEWDMLDRRQQRALADHELHHCALYPDGKKAIRKHDFEEFNCIIERYGFWRPHGKGTEIAVQAHLLIVPGRVEAVNPATMNRDVMDQIGDLLDDDE